MTVQAISAGCRMPHGVRADEADAEHPAIASWEWSVIEQRTRMAEWAVRAQMEAKLRAYFERT